MARKKIKSSKVRGGSSESRRMVARWLFAARRNVRQAGNYFEKVHDGIFYIVRGPDHRGLMSHFFFDGTHKQEDIQKPVGIPQATF